MGNLGHIHSFEIFKMQTLQVRNQKKRGMCTIIITNTKSLRLTCSSDVYITYIWTNTSNI
ncbi:hypothetical protein K449DRAFT_387802 [Hypoxylon sp. EC38]|nr:hypothetical protein K449DRAFT_387802 [Hypoxylon sp. EC38]